MEIIVVGDASIDGTREILEKISRKIIGKTSCIMSEIKAKAPRSARASH